MENKLIDKINVTGELRLEERVSKKGTTYKACVLCVNGVDRLIGFDVDYFTLRKIIKGGVK